MEFRESAKRDLEETIAEIASILGEGYLRYRRGRRLPTFSPDMGGNVAVTFRSPGIKAVCLGQAALGKENRI